MKAVKQFPVFGEQVEVMISSEDTNGAFSMIVQTCPPGGGPPPHVHNEEDELFRVLEGEFELFDGKRYNKLVAGDYAYMLRGQPHTFRNCGSTEGRMQAIIVPGKMDRYLEAISVLQMPQDMARLVEISDGYGIHFLQPEAPEVAPV